MKGFRLVAIGGIALGSSSAIQAYDPAVHRDMSAAAHDVSHLQQQQAVLSSLGLDSLAAFRNSLEEGPKAIRALIIDGAIFEDDVPRSLNHFFDPISGAPLSVLGMQPLGNYASPDWALEDTGQVALGWQQDFSYREANSYLYKALTFPAKADRDTNFGLLFETLGRVIHHVQDMAQPQHVRNDAHLDADLPWWQDALWCLVPIANNYCVVYRAIKNPSAYEKYTKERVGRLSYLGYAPIYPGPQLPLDDPVGSPFRVPRDFWKTYPYSAGLHAGKGIAEFTNTNFVSAGTNFNSGKYASPALDPFKWKDEDIRVLCQENPPCPPSLNGLMRMYGTDVVDRVTGLPSVPNARASTYSIFDADLTRKGRFPTFTLNRFNYEAAQQLLIPRAVGYSAGLINFFFRGSIDLVADSDDATSFRIANWGQERLSGKFALYYDATDGQRNAVQGAVWNLNIDPTAANSTEPSLSDAITFGPPLDAKSPGTYVLVFNGTQGQEAPANGSLGAVIGKITTVSHVGGLYVAGLDAQGQMIYLRVDRGGTHALMGSEFNPFPGMDLPTDADFSPHKTRLYKFKQVRFGKDANGAAGYTVAALAMNDIPEPNDAGVWRINGTILDDPTGSGLAHLGAAWLASSPDPAIGRFIFSVGDPGGPLSYARSWTDMNGQRRYNTGTIALPGFSDPVVIKSYWGFHDGTLAISPDGLTISGLETESSIIDNTAGNVETATLIRKRDSLQITLDAVPVVTLIEEPYTYAAGRTETVPESTFQIGTDSIAAPAGCADPGYTPSVIAVNETTYSQTHSLVLSSERTPIGYFNGNLATYEYSEHFDYSDVTDRVFDFNGVSVLYGRCCPPTYDWVKSNERGAWTLDQKREAAWQFQEGDVVAWHYPSQTVHSYKRQFEGCYSDLPPYPPDSGSSEYFEQKVGRALTGRAADAITYFRASPADHYTVQFRGTDITGKLHAADASPLGEVFFALGDLSVVIHEPIAGRMPKITIPANMVKVIAAVWM